MPSRPEERSHRPGPSRLLGRTAEAWIAALVVAIPFLAPWLGALASGDPVPLPRHPTQSAVGAEGHLAAWRLAAAARSAEQGQRPEWSDWIDPPRGVALGGADHGLLYWEAAEPAVQAFGAPGALWLGTALLVAAGALAVQRLVRAAGGSTATSAGLAIAWSLSPAAVEGTLGGPITVWAPTLPWAALGAALVLSPGPGGGRRSLLGGAVGALALGLAPWIGASTALGTAVAVSAGLGLGRLAGAADAGRDRRGPGLPGLLALGGICFGGLVGAVHSERVRNDPDRDVSTAVVGPAAVPETRVPARRPLVGPPPFHPLLREHLESVPGTAPLVPVTVAVLGLLSLPLRRARRWALTAVIGSATVLWVLPAGIGAALAPLVPLVWVVAAAVRLESLSRTWLRWLLLSLVVAEVWVWPLPTAQIAASPTCAAIAASPVPGALLDLPRREGPSPAHSRQRQHRRPTPWPLAPATEPPRRGVLATLAPEVERLRATGSVEDPEALAAELEWLGVGHLLLEGAFGEPSLEGVLDRLPGWERGPAFPGEALRWWYRTRELWSLRAGD
jgi:hypothetical protein